MKIANESDGEKKMCENRVFKQTKSVTKSKP